MCLYKDIIIDIINVIISSEFLIQIIKIKLFEFYLKLYNILTNIQKSKYKKHFAFS